MDPTDNADPAARLDPSPAAVAPQDWQGLASRWLASIKQAQKLYDKQFYRRGDKIIKEYRIETDREGTPYAGSRFPMFWSNVQTLAPATYSRKPKVEVTRRFRDSDPVGRVAGAILERALQYEIDLRNDLHETAKGAVMDRLLPGMGCAWVRYEPTFENQQQLLPNPEDPAAEPVPQSVEVVADEFTPVDYVFWKDFVISPARTWADVRWVARRLMFSEEKLRIRFGKTTEGLGGDITRVPLNYDPVEADPDSRDRYRPAANPDTDTTLRRALVWELWDRESKQAIWVSEGYDFPLDVREDPLKLDGFLPCPQPLFATMTTDRLVPVADFVVYRSQINELNTLTNRISMLQSALRVIGVYDASQSSLQTLLQSGLENRMVPVNQWAAFADKGGLKSVMDFVPIEQVFKVLQGLYEAREQVKQTVYEITGMADIVRGATMASETLGAQQIKAKFANLRLSARQKQVAEFVTSVLNIKAEIMCSLYSPETLVRISSAEQIMELQRHPEALQPALALLKNEKARKYRIEIASDSMVELDEVEQQERRTSFMSNVSNFMLAMKNVTVLGPEMVPVALEMLKFVVRGFSVGKGLESAIEDASAAIMQRLSQPQPPQPSPDVVFKEQQATQRTLIQEDGATDREELKAATALTTAGMDAEAQALATAQQTIDASMDADAASEFGAPAGRLQ